MSMYKGHILFGLIFTSVVVYLSYRLKFLNFSYTELLISTPIIFCYSILPDIDIRSSKIRKIVTTVSLAFILVSIFFDVKWLAISITLTLFILQFTKHRRFFHSISAGVLFSLPLILFSQVVALIAFLGFFSHLFLDGKIKMF